MQQAAPALLEREGPRYPPDRETLLLTTRRAPHTLQMLVYDLSDSAPASFAGLELLKSSCHLAKGQSDLLAQREKVAVRAMQTQAAASVSQMGEREGLLT